MCDPLTIVGVALTLGSTAANYVANQQVQAARNDALAAERIRQKGFDQESMALNAASQDQYTDFTGDQADRGEQLGDYFANQNIAEPTPVAALPTSSSDIIVKDEAAKRADAQTFTDNAGQALGQLRAFGDVLADKSLVDSRNASLIAQLGGFKQGSAAVLPFELDEANKQGDGLKLLADVLGGLGTVGTTAGLAGGTLPFLKPQLSGVAAGAAKAASQTPMFGGGVTRLSGLF